MNFRRAWSKIRRIWIAAGTVVFVGFTAWSLVAYQATGEARDALQSDDQVHVTRHDSSWTFLANGAAGRPAVGLLFFPGALVEPAAYAPLARAVAAAGYPALLVELPWRGGFGAADRPEALDRARAAMRRTATVKHWVAAGHSRGAGVAAKLVQTDPNGIVGLVLIGSSLPRDFSLAATTIPVTKVYGTHDGLAGVETIEQTRGNLPASTTWIRIEGGNHSQFGSYGFQPFDWRATISRDQQQALTLQALTAALERAARAVASAATKM